MSDPNNTDPPAPRLKKHAGRMVRDRATYDRVTELFRQAPGNFRTVAREAGLSRNAVTILWKKGWPNQPWAPPIWDVLQREVIEARAKAIQREKDKNEADEARKAKIRASIDEALEEEAKLATLMRRDVLSTAALVAKLIRPMDALAQHVTNTMFNPDGTMRQLNMSPFEAMSIMRQFGQMVRAVSLGANLVHDMAAKRKPVDVDLVDDGHDMTIEEALEELAAGQVMHERLTLAEASSRPVVDTTGEDGEQDAEP